MAGYKHKRGSSVDLPVEGSAGEIFITTDTAQLYGGQGNNKSLVSFSIKRYQVGIKSFVTATGLGVEIIKVNNTCSFSIPIGVTILSASIHFEASEISDNTNCIIYLPNTSYDDFYSPKFQVWADVDNSRAYKTGIAGNINISANTLELTALKEYQAVWVRIDL